MTDREKAIITAYTGITMLTGDKFSIFHKYIEDIMGRPIWTHELANPNVWDEIKEKSRDDFLRLCAEAENQNDLISREALKNAFKAWKTMDDYYHDTDCNDIPLSEAFDLINNAPTVERPIRGIAKMGKNGNIEIELLKPQGKWIEFKGGYYKCDNCGEVERAKKNFCSNCGAKMLNG